MVSSLQATEDSVQRALASEILLHLRCQQGPGTSENRPLYRVPPQPSPSTVGDVTTEKQTLNWI